MSTNVGASGDAGEAHATTAREAAAPSSITRVPDQIFERTIDDLRTAGVDVTLLDRLRQALLVDRSYSEASLRKALFGAEPAK